MQASNHSKRRGMLWLTKLIPLRNPRQCKRGLQQTPIGCRPLTPTTHGRMAGADTIISLGVIVVMKRTGWRFADTHPVLTPSPMEPSNA